MDGEVVIGTDTPERALDISRRHGFDVQRDDDGLLARFAAGESAERAAASLNQVLCDEGIRVHALTPRQHSLEALYRDAGRAGVPHEPLPSPIAA